MIAALLSLLLAAPPQALEMGPPLAAPPTPVTIPSTRLECNLRKDDGTDIRFVLQRAGGETLRISGAAMGTRLAAEIIDDPGNVLSGYKLDAWGVDSVFGRAREGASELAGRPFGEVFQILIDRTGQEPEPDQPTRVAMQLQEHRAPQWGMHPYVRAVGFCDANPGPPAPLIRPDAKEPGQ